MPRRIKLKMYLDEQSLKTSHTRMVLEHNNQSIYWDISAYDKKSFLRFDVCQHINEFWARLHPARQEKIFQIYYRIREIYEEVYDVTALIKEISCHVVELFNEHPVEEINRWIDFHSDIIIPTKNIEEEYIASDEKPGSREKTYLRSDYKELVGMSMVLRIMVPIWGEFIFRTKKETGTQFKELHAFQLIMHTWLPQCNAYEKLRTYIVHNIQNDKPVLNIVISGVGTEDFPDWLLSMVIVRRLCIGDIRGVSVDSSLVTFIFNYVNQKVTGAAGGNFATMVKGKSLDTAVTDEHNASRLEGYKIKLKLPIGDLAILEHYLSNPYIVAKKLNPNINLEFLEESLHNCQLLQHEQLQPCQVALAQYVIKPVIPPRALTHLNKVCVINAIAVAQTALWQAGHKQLAALISAVPTKNDMEMLVSSIDSKARIPKELAEQIDKLFPYTRLAASRRKTKAVNNVIQAIDELSAMFGQRDWIITLKQDKLAEITGNQFVSRYGCPHDIKILLARLIIELAQSR